jgi:hypothetical protein
MINRSIFPTKQKNKKIKINNKNMHAAHLVERSKGLEKKKSSNFVKCPYCAGSAGQL